MLCFGHITVTATKNGARVKDFKDVSEEKKPNPIGGNGTYTTSGILSDCSPTYFQ
jgi:hypothetical protein